VSDVTKWWVVGAELYENKPGVHIPVKDPRGNLTLVVLAYEYDRDVAALREERDKLAATVERVKALSHFHAMNAWGDVVGYVVRVADLDRVLAGPEPRVERRERTSDRRQARDDA